MTETTCTRCGTNLPQEGRLEGVCPACLLRDQLLAAPRCKDGNEGTEEQELLELRALFPQLEILDRIGRGGMGVVYKARQPRLGRTIAIKVLAPEISNDPSFAERFTREAQALARLNHPNIVTVYDFGEQGELFYLLMEYVEGVGLREQLGSGKLSPTAVLAIVPQVCEGLQYAHEHGVVHRDIKPENILVDDEGKVKIADFGLAKLLEQDAHLATLTRKSQIVGTPHYMAPEQATRPLEVDHRADIYSLGVVFYELLTGDLPVGVFQPPSERIGVDERVDRVVYKALEQEPDRRYQEASQVGSDVESISRSGTSLATPVGANEVEPLRWIDRIPAPPLVVAWAAAALGVLWMYRLGIHLSRAALPGGVYWSAVAYPLGFLAIQAARRSAKGPGRYVALTAGFVVCVASALLTSGGVMDSAQRSIQTLASAILVSAHLVFDSGLRARNTRFTWTSILITAGLVVLAAVIHSVPAPNKWSEAAAYIFGMFAILAGTTGVVTMPEVMLSTAPRPIYRALLVSFGLGILFAILYFSKAYRAF